MHKNLKSPLIASLIFIFLVMFSLFFVNPIFRSLNRKIDGITKSISSMISEKGQVKIKYKSLSPSILSSFLINEISVFDRQDNLIITINRAKIAYSINKIFSGNVNQIVKSAVLDGISVDGTNLEKYILKIVELYSDPDDEKKIFTPEEILLTVEEVIPQRIVLKNFYADYEGEFFEASASLKKVCLSYAGNKSGFKFSADGNGHFYLPDYALNLSGAFSLDSSLFSDNKIDGSVVNVTLDSLTDGNLSLSKTNLRLFAKENQLHLISEKNDFPLDIDASYDWNKKRISGGVKLKDFYPSQLISVNKNGKIAGERKINLDDREEKSEAFKTDLKSTAKAKNALTSEQVPEFEAEKRQKLAEEILEKIKGMKLSLSLNADYDILENHVAYNSSGTVLLPPDLIPDGLTADYSFFGNDRKINLQALNLNGKNYSASASLEFIFDGLQAFGVIDVPYYNLPNGNVFSAEIYLDTLNKVYTIFSPNVFIGDTSLTALQANIIPLKDSIDFAVEVSDYSHADESEPGTISLEGSYLTDSKYLQASLSLNSFFADSLAKIGASVVEKNLSEKMNGFITVLSPYMLSVDGYVSTDLKSLSYNVPKIIFADTTKDNVALFMAVNGTEQSVQINNLNLVYGKQSFNAALSLDKMPSSKDMFFMCDFSYGSEKYSSVPYHFSGSVMPELINITGDYGSDIRLNLTGRSFSGHAVFDNLPIIVENASMAFSLDADFDYSQSEGPSVQINRMVLEETGSLFSTNPVLSMAGNATKYGAQFSSISFTDQFSTLEGFSNISVNMADKVFDSATIEFDISNPISKEGIRSNIVLSTPMGSVNGLKSLLSSLFVDCQINLSHFSLNRFSTIKNDDNEISLSANMSGPIEHPLITLDIEKISMIIGGILAKANGNAIIEDGNVMINDFVFDYQGMQIKDVSASFSMDDFTGFADATFYADMMGRTANIPLHFEILDSDKTTGDFLPTAFSAQISSKNMGGTMIKKPADFSIGLIYMNKNISFYSSENLGLQGFFDESGNLSFKINSENFFNIEAAGHIKKDDVAIKFSNINANLKEILSYMNFDDLFQLGDGILKGSLMYTENPDGPEFNGTLAIANPVMQIPMFVPYDIKTDRIMILFKGNEILLTENSYSVKNRHRFKLSGRMFLNKWMMDHAEAAMETVEKELIPIKYVHPYFSLEGELGCKLDILLDDSDCNVTGAVLCENLLLKSSLTDVLKKTERTEKIEKVDENSSSLMDFHVDVGLKLGTHAMINFDPLLRCIFVPNTSVRFIAELEDGYFDIKGNLGIKSGDISYLSRNFYIKEGNVKFNSDDLLNPAITIRAETREKDDKGENLRIIISAENQLLSKFEPKFSSIPAKSENEIRKILGQIAIGYNGNETSFSENGRDGSATKYFLGAGGDTLLQSTVFRGFENKLRNLMNIDIFSVRTNIVQNIMQDNQTAFSPKQLLDNTSLYVGRYFGDRLYFDAMVNLSYNDGFGFSSGNSMQILPEFGVEFELPGLGFLNTPKFSASSNLRWSMTPDFSAMMNGKILPNSSVTLSWKFSF